MVLDRRTFLRSGVAGSALLFAGCSESSETPETDTHDHTHSGMDTTTSASTTEPSTTTSTEADETVDIRGFAYDPMRFSVSPGTTVEWTNYDSAPHDVVNDQFHDEATAWEFSSATLSQGDSTTHTFDSEGVYEYYCSIHGAESMCGVVLVGDVTLDQSLPCEDGDK